MEAVGLDELRQVLPLVMTFERNMDFIGPLFGKVPMALVFVQDEDQAIVTEPMLFEILEKAPFRTNLFGVVCEKSAEGPAARVRSILKLGRYVEDEDLGPFVCVFSEDTKYLHLGELTPEALVPFFTSVLDGSADVYHASGARPLNDSDPEFPGITILTYDTFDELVVNTETETFVDLYADWCGPCRAVAPHIADVARVLEEIGAETYQIGKYDVDSNDSPPGGMFPEDGIPNMKMLVGPAGTKEAIKFSESRNPESILRWIHTTSRQEPKFDLEAALERLVVLGGPRAAKEKIQIMVRKLMIGMEIDENAAFPRFGEVVELVSQGNVALQSQEEEVVMEFAGICDAQADLLAEYTAFLERLQHKNVVIIDNEEQLEERIQGADPGQVIVLDVFADWCGPCRRIAPIYAEFSERYDDVLFLKIDSEGQDELIQKLGVESFPTFLFYRGGEIVDRVRGADPRALMMKIENLKRFEEVMFEEVTEGDQ